MSGRCIAGLELKNERVGNWIRPVSARPDIRKLAGKIGESLTSYLYDIAKVNPALEGNDSGSFTSSNA